MTHEHDGERDEDEGHEVPRGLSWQQATSCSRSWDCATSRAGRPPGRSPNCAASGSSTFPCSPGDNRRTARAIAGELGLDEVFAELKPEGKVAQVKQLHERFGSIRDGRRRHQRRPRACDR